MTDEGLRERKKRETRRRIHAAALDLTARHGLAAVTVEAIAAEADVSPRTFFNYFPSKDAAVVGASADLAESLAAAFAARPADEDPAASLRAIITDHLVATAAEPELREQSKRLMVSHPELAVALAGVTRQAQQSLAEAVAARAGVEVDADPYPRLVVGVAFAAVSSTLARRHALRSLAGDMRDDLDTAFDLIEAGVPRPSQIPD